MPILEIQGKRVEFASMPSPEEIDEVAGSFSRSGFADAVDKTQEASVQQAIAEENVKHPYRAVIENLVGQFGKGAYQGTTLSRLYPEEAKQTYEQMPEPQNFAEKAFRGVGAASAVVPEFMGVGKLLGPVANAGVNKLLTIPAVRTQAMLHAPTAAVALKAGEGAAMLGGRAAARGEEVLPAAATGAVMFPAFMVAGGVGTGLGRVIAGQPGAVAGEALGVGGAAAAMAPEGQRLEAGIVGTAIGAVGAGQRRFIPRRADQNKAYEVELRNVVKTGIYKGGRPSIRGNRTINQQEAGVDKAMLAVKKIVENKGSLESTGGKLPTSVRDGAIVASELKEKIFDKYNPMIQAASDRGEVVNGDDVANSLRAFAEAPEVRDVAPNLASYALATADRYAGKQYPLADAERMLRALNKMLKEKYASGQLAGADISTAAVDDKVAGILRSVIAEKAGVGELKKEWGALKEFEDKLAYRALMLARNNKIGLLEGFSNLSVASDVGAAVLASVVTGDPRMMAWALKGAGTQAIASYIKSVNSPDANISRMFSEAEKLYGKLNAPVETEQVDRQMTSRGSVSDAEMVVPISGALPNNSALKEYVPPQQQIGTPIGSRKALPNLPAEKMGRPGYADNPPVKGQKRLANEGSGEVILMGEQPLPIEQGGMSVPVRPRVIEQGETSVKVKKTPINTKKESKGTPIPRRKGVLGNNKGQVILPGGEKKQTPIPDKAKVSPLGFYSKAEQVINDKIPNGADATQIKNTLLNNGVKPDEIEHLGINNLSGKVSKEDLQTLVKANNVPLEEKVLGDSPVKAFDGWTNEQIRKHYEDVIGEPVPEGRSITWVRNAISEFEAEDWAGRDSPPGQPKFSQYQLPGGENYREVGILLPRKSEELLTDLPEGYTIKEIAGTSRNPDKKFYVSNEKGIGVAAGLTRESAIKNTLNILNQDIRNANNKTDFSSSHFPDWKNPIVHARINDRIVNGKKVLFIEEIQSDWHQKGRKEGYDKKLEFKDLVANKHPHGWEVMDKDGRVIYTSTTSKTAEEAKYEAIGMGKTSTIPDAPFKKTWHELMFKRLLNKAVKEGYDSVAWTTGEQQAERYKLSKQVDRLSWSMSPNQKVKYVNIAAKDKSGIELKINPESGVIEHSSHNQGGNLVGKNIEDVVGKDVGIKIKESRMGDLSGDGLDVGGEGMKGFYDQMLPSFVNKYTKKWGGRVGRAKVITDSFDDVKNVKEYSNAEVHSLDITPTMREEVKRTGQPLWQIIGATALGVGASSTAEAKDYNNDGVDGQKIVDNLFDATIETEGLKDRQTPIRSKAKESYKGVKVSQEKDKGRENFIYTKNNKERDRLIRMQWYKYFSKPQNFGLTENATLEQVIRKMDQERPENKIEFLKKRGIDPAKITVKQIRFDLKSAEDEKKSTPIKRKGE